MAIGDIHSDPDALLQILEHRGLINPAGEWAGGTTHLVFMGDFVDRGPDSRTVLDIVIRLEEQARAAGGKVHSLVGNHDVMVLEGDLRYAKTNDKQGYDYPQNRAKAKKLSETPPHPAPEDAAMQAAFMGESKYARWMRKRNSVIQIGNRIFAHAGLTEWPLTVSPGEANSTVRSWVRHFQGNGPKPDAGMGWVLVEPHSPFWNRSQAFDAGFSPSLRRYLAAEGVTEMDQATLDKILSHLGAERLAIAHSPTTTNTIETSYQGKVVRLDTRISIGYGGKLSAMDIDAAGQPTFYDNIPRPVGQHPLLATVCRRVARQAP